MLDHAVDLTTLDTFFAENAFSKRTEEQYRDILKVFLSHVDPENCTVTDVLAFLRSTRWGNSRQHVASVAIRHFFRWKYGENHPVLRLRIKREKPHPGRTLKVEQIIQILNSFDTTTKKGCRDYAIACFALDTGLRVNEIANVQINDLDLQEREVLVKIKGGRWEKAYFSGHTAEAISKWLPYRDPNNTRLFQVTRDGLKVIVRKWGEKLGFKLSPHDFRRTFAVMTIRAGAPSRLVQIAGRWSDIRMVEYYTRDITAVDLGPYFPITNIQQRVRGSSPR
ncbi:tyrosine-type recombinase/integrase [Thermanaerothrix sp. 4228-RoL]|uniref:Tyrosine-type recombinase/integrase n=2 Tax=Thermanaerothrix TaxID=1077886 RepID=A0ABU3NPI7_9CHLR|nr:tyrosine-type recombinase/integrase [Thermanaerothrix sp. 4228-RoL]MDT8898285.1 tyrosine-type recombinase/integrase [Thermanaerothrix sp. 4228-RoL]